ncbi:E3 SUMO-protein ligase ZBED1 [Labeo rohita]|uniref:E3 SUMO-protein ligase ZBED1 n=1 Tax=Labeo rohita TaxID=84645 RepID=A0ABQ8L305_LABRO|nr:E3 SUMO-protein ligase ZBED1 [Labeo rohita]
MTHTHQLAMRDTDRARTVKNDLPPDNPTHWNSTFYLMILLAQRRALGAYGSEFEVPASFSTFSNRNAAVNAYLSEPTISRSESPLQFWKTNMSRFLALAQAAHKYLSAPCTSVDREGLFSAASNVIDEKRNRLTGTSHKIRIL